MCMKTRFNKPFTEEKQANITKKKEIKLRVPNQNGVSQAWYIVAIYHSGRKPLKCLFKSTLFRLLSAKKSEKSPVTDEQQLNIFSLPRYWDVYNA